MPVYEGKKPGTWRVVVWSNGKRHEELVEGTKKDARRHEAKMRLDLGAGKIAATRAAPDFESFCVERYKPHAKQHLKASTWGKVRRYQVETLIRFFGRYRLPEITPEVVEAYKRSRKVGATSVNNELRVLRTILNFAREQGIDLTPAKFRKLPVRGHGRVRVWTPAQIQTLFASSTVEAPELLPILVFLANTGCRKGEAIACEWSWVDLEGDMLRIPSNEVWQPKNGMPREVPLSTSLRALLEGERRHETYVFPNRLDARYACFPEDLFRRTRDAAKLKGGPHTLRHSFASAFLARRPDMFLLAQVLGHSHERVTELYSHLLPEHLSQARNAVDFAPPGLVVPETVATTVGEETESRVLH